MVGRSCRRFGLCKGNVYVVSGTYTPDLTGGKEYLERNDNQRHIHDGFYIAEALFKKMPKIESKSVRKEIIEVTQDPVVWKVTREEFSNNNLKVLRLLKEQNYIPTTKW